MWAAIALSFGLAMDATAVAAARGLGGRRADDLIVLPLLFGGFQSGMAALGWLVGAWGGSYLQPWDAWIAFALLLGLGGKMIVDGWRSRADSGDVLDGTVRTSIAVYLALAIATSIDAAAAGLTLPILAVPPWLSLALIGGVTAACTLAGHLLGRALGDKLGPRLGIAGGLVLVAIGAHMVLG